MTDVELLNEHRNGSESAFADIVRRHLSWVYGVARRRLGDSHLAEDVAQAVFVLLHRKAPEFAYDGAMINWLHKTAYYASETAARSEHRRRAHEMTAAQVRSADSADPAEWQALAPVLDRLIEKLSPEDREAVLLRYYRELSFAEVAQQIGSTPEAARKRVDRAIEKLRTHAATEGIGASAIVLVGFLSKFVRVAPPNGLLATATVTATAQAGSAMAASCATIVKGAAVMTSATKIGLIAGTVFGVLVLIGGTVAVTAYVMSGSNNSSAPAAPGPAAPAPAPAAATAAPPTPYQTIVPQQSAGSGANPDFSTAPTSSGRQLYARLSPFTAVNWKGDKCSVQLNGKWFELVSINGQTVNALLKETGDFDVSRQQKHFSEDLVEVMTRSGHAPGNAVKLELRTVDTGTPVTIPNAHMSEENRQAVCGYNSANNQ